MEDSVSMILLHLGVNVETRVAQFCNLFGQQFYPVHRVAKDDGLIDLQLRRSVHVSLVAALTFEKRVFRQCTFCLSSTKA